MDDLVIRPAVPGDVIAVAELIAEIERYYGATEVQAFEDRVTQTKQALFGSPPLASVLLAEVDSQIVGLAAYSFLWPAAGSTHSLYLKELYVRESSRRSGVGAGLMAEIRTIASARPGCSRVEWTADRDNPTSVSFYRALGYQQFDGKVMYRLPTKAALG